MKSSLPQFAVLEAMFTICKKALIRPISLFRAFSVSRGTMGLKVLNVAEKNDAAKCISEIMSRGRSNRREGLSKFNKIYEFQYEIQGQLCDMTMTSVSGHLLNLEFSEQYKKWWSCSPVQLFEAPVNKICKDDYNKIKKTLEREARSSQWLIIWTDCDREGENIGFEIIDVCKAVKPSLRVFRARFSEITRPSIDRAVRQLIQPDIRQSQAVDVRQELDLRIGAAFTRFQTLRLQKRFPSLANQLISYGSCQFPTMGFVVERYKAIENFVPEQFWKIKVLHEIDNMKVEFNWKRVRLFNQTAAQVYHDICQENPKAKVEEVKSKPKNKWRPLPLDTVELEKLGARKLRMSAKETMTTAEKLYTQGYISYPRTETNIFPKELNLTPLVEMQTQDPDWGGFANGVLQDGGPRPRAGKKSDQAHPPIHPTKYTKNLHGNEGRLYEFIVRHFLACVSKDALGKETTVNIDINGEKFVGHGLTVIERNYLEVYPYERWSDKEIIDYEQIPEFDPTSIELAGGQTQAPPLLTEADLIALMDKHGIGTDATHAEHIETIKSRQYVGIHERDKLVPGKLGIALCDGYDAMGFEMSKPHLRSGLENDLKLICQGRKDPATVLQEQIATYKRVFEIAVEKVDRIDAACAQYLNEVPQEIAVAQGNPSGGPAPLVNGQMNCHCDQLSIERTVNKDGPNKGRKFWVCAKPRDQPDHCDFFQWADEPPRTQVTGDDGDAVQCQCGRAAAKRMVNKEGANKGREFFACATPFTAPGRCDFFQWADEPPRAAPVQHTQSRAPTQPRPSQQARPSTAQFRPPTQPRPTQPMTPVDDDLFPDDDPMLFPDDIPQDVTCNCGQVANKRTVQKEGVNKGREFYACALPMNQDGRCNFFKWADDISAGGGSSGYSSGAGPSTGTQQRRNFTTASNFNSGATSDPRRNFPNAANFQPTATPTGQVTCNCGQPARTNTVKKDGPNKGREFFACPISYTEPNRCDFFQWNDGDSSRAPLRPMQNSFDGGNYRGGGARGGFGGRGGGRGVGRGRAADGGERRQRKCGLCKEPGHTRKKCPMNNEGYGDGAWN